MPVIAKFYSSGLVTREDNQGHKWYQVEMNPVSSGSKENEMFFKWTPGGQVVVSTSDPELARRLSKGQFYVTFAAGTEAHKLGVDPVLAAPFQVSLIGNASSGGRNTEKLYRVEMRGVNKDGYVTSDKVDLSTINHEAAKEFIGFDPIMVAFTPA